MSEFEILQGDAVARLRDIPDEVVQTCVTSPPYFGLRDYGVAGQIGVEPTPEEYVARLVEVFAGVRRVLKPDGTLWLNLGDSYASAGGRGEQGTTSQRKGRSNARAQEKATSTKPPPGLKPKDLIGIPWLVAFALRAAGWYLRADVIWHKPNPMPESVTDRPTRAHEYLFLLSKSERYLYDAEAVAEESAQPDRKRADRFGGNKYVEGVKHSDGSIFTGAGKRNRRSVWTIATRPFRGAHFATFPPTLVEPCVLAGSRPGDLVLDPFNGAGTTGLVSLQHGRDYLGIELNPEYIALAEERLRGVA